jgi:hypothetical protein
MAANTDKKTYHKPEIKDESTFVKKTLSAGTGAGDFALGFTVS